MKPLKMKEHLTEDQGADEDVTDEHATESEIFEQATA